MGQLGPGMDNFNANHKFWQKRLSKEKRIHAEHVQLSYGQKSKEILAPKVPPAPTADEVMQAQFERMYRSTSTPALMGASGTGGPTSPVPRPSQRPASKDSRAARRARPPLGSASSGLVGPGGTRSAKHWMMSATPPLGTAGSSYRPNNSVFFASKASNGLPPTPSVRTPLTSVSHESALWREVESVVAEEVAKIVGPLQQQLEKERAERERVEAALLAKGS